MSDTGAALTEYLRRSLAAELPANVVLMHLLMRAREPFEARGAIERVRRDLEKDCDPRKRERLAAIARLWDAHPAAWAIVRAVAADHGATADGGQKAPAHWATLFDRLAATAPEAGVALYSLGDPDLLNAATAAAYLRGRRLIGPERKVLEIGCGTGRLIEALAPDVACIAGLDVSADMIRLACRRCAAFPNVRLGQTSGEGLASFADAAFDLVLAVDVLPYVFAGGGELVWRNVSETARVLRSGGTFAFFNFSYRDDIEADRTDVRRLAAEAGFAVVQDGARPFARWDGAAFLLVKRA